MRIPEPKQKKSGRWYIQLMVDGTRLNRTFDSREDALYWASGLKTKSAQDARSPRRLTVGEAIDRYIESKDGVLSPTTLWNYKKSKKNDFESIQSVQLRNLTQETVQRWVNQLAKKKSPKTVSNAHGLLSVVLAAYYPDMHLRTTLPQKSEVRSRSRLKRSCKKSCRPVRGHAMSCPFCWLSGWACGSRKSWVSNGKTSRETISISGGPW